MRNYWEPKGKRGHRPKARTYDEIAAALEDHLPDCDWHHGRPFADCKCLSAGAQERLAEELREAEAEADTEPMRRAEPLQPRYVRARDW